jgi:hypothetical protein
VRRPAQREPPGGHEVSAQALLRTVVAALDEAGIPHMLVGSHASMAHGAPRSTNDIDIVIDPTPSALAAFLKAFDDQRYYVPASASDAVARRDQFNIIDSTTGWKVDLIVPADRPFSRSELDRRVRTTVLGVDLWMATPEDTVLAKLEWAAMGESGRQLADAATVLAVLADTIDDDYLDRWAPELGVTELLAEARRS